MSEQCSGRLATWDKTDGWTCDVCGRPDPQDVSEPVPMLNAFLMPAHSKPAAVVLLPRLEAHL